LTNFLEKFTWWFGGGLVIGPKVLVVSFDLVLEDKKIILVWFSPRKGAFL